MRFKTDPSSVEDHQTINATLRETRKHAQSAFSSMWLAMMKYWTLNKLISQLAEMNEASRHDQHEQRSETTWGTISSERRGSNLEAWVKIRVVSEAKTSRQQLCGTDVWWKNPETAQNHHELHNLLEGFKVKSSEFTKRTKTVRCISIRQRRGTFLMRWLSSGRRSTWTEKHLSLRLQHHNLYLSFTSQEQLLLKTHPWESHHGLLNLTWENNSLTFSTKKPPDIKWS